MITTNSSSVPHTVCSGMFTRCMSYRAYQIKNFKIVDHTIIGPQLTLKVIDGQGKQRRVARQCFAVVPVLYVFVPTK